MKLRLTILVLAAIACLSTSRADASNFTYDLALDATSGSESGAGSFTVSGPIATSGLSIFTAGSGLTSLNFSIAGYNFSMADALLNASVTFNNGNLVSIAYLGDLNGFKLDLGTLGLDYVFVDFLNLSLSSFGTISDPPPSATPLPAAWTLMLIGLAAFGLWAYRRKRLLAA